MKRLLIPLDGSKIAEAALPSAMSLARQYGAEVYLLRITASAGTLHPTADGQLRGGADERGADSRTYLEGIAATFAHEGVRVETLVVGGYPASVILEVADELDADLIVMSTHGRSGIGRTFLGSVTDHVICHGARPVLVAHPPEVCGRTARAPAHGRSPGHDQTDGGHRR